jgi:hypothetical protein
MGLRLSKIFENPESVACDISGPRGIPVERAFRFRKPSEEELMNTPN